MAEELFILKATYKGYSGGEVWLSFSGDNYAILFPNTPVHMIYNDRHHLHAPRDNFPLAVNPKEMADYGGRGSWLDWAFDKDGIPVVFIDGQIAQEEHQEKRLCLHQGDDRRVHWSDSASDPSTNYLLFTKIPYTS